MRTTSSIGSKSMNSSNLDLNKDFLNATEQLLAQLIEFTDRFALDESRRLLRSLQALRKRNSLDQVKLAIFGNSESSKADLIRTLIQTTPQQEGVPLGLPTSTWLAYGPEAECAITLSNGFNVRLPLHDLAPFLKEQGDGSNPIRIVARIPNDSLKTGLVVIDTPPLSGDPELWASSLQIAQESDACVLVLDTEELPELASVFLRTVTDSLARFFIVLNHPAHNEFAPFTSAPSIPASSIPASSIFAALLREHGVPGSRTLELHLSGSSSLPDSSASPNSYASPSSFPSNALATRAFQSSLLQFARTNSHASLAAHLAAAASEVLALARRALASRSGLLQLAKLRRAVTAIAHLSEHCDALLASTEAPLKLPSPRPQPEARQQAPAQPSLEPAAEPQLAEPKLADPIPSPALNLTPDPLPNPASHPTTTPIPELSPQEPAISAPLPPNPPPAEEPRPRETPAQPTVSPTPAPPAPAPPAPAPPAPAPPVFLKKKAFAQAQKFLIEKAPSHPGAVQPDPLPEASFEAQGHRPEPQSTHQSRPQPGSPGSRPQEYASSLRPLNRS